MQWMAGAKAIIQEDAGSGGGTFGGRGFAMGGGNRT